MTLKKILNESSILKYIRVSIDDQFEIIEEDLDVLEIKYNLFEFMVVGSLIFKDSYDFKNNGLVSLKGTNKLKISLTDIGDVKSVRYYYITEIKTTPENENRFQNIEIKFVDEFTYILSNTYLSKSFKNVTAIEAFQQYLTHLGIDDILTKNQMEYDIVDPGVKRNIVVPQNISVLEYFQNYFVYENVRFYQDRKKIYLKPFNPTELEIPLDPEGDELEYTDNTMNNLYLFKIHDHMVNNNSKIAVNASKPVEKIYRYNFEKKIVNETTNLLDFKDEISLNTFDMSGIQETQGERFGTQGYFYYENQKYELFDTYFQNNTLWIVVPGSLEYSVLGSLVKVKLKGNPIFEESSSKGNEYTNGKYVITAISDKIIKDKIIQRIQLSRFDAFKPSLVEG